MGKFLLKPKKPFPTNFVISSFLKLRTWAKQSDPGLPRSKISDVDFIWDTRLSIGDTRLSTGDLQGALGGPISDWLQPKKCLKSSDSPLSSVISGPLSNF